MKHSITILALIIVFIGFIQTTLTATGKDPVNEAVPANHTEVIFKSNELERRAFLYLPDNYESKLSPLVIALHGFGGSAAKIIKDQEWSKKAALESFIVAYPQGTRPDPSKSANVWKNPQSWNDGSGRFNSGRRNIDDVTFIKELIGKISADYQVDPKRIFITGFSNGASMTFRLGAELSDSITAIAPCAGTDWNTNIELKGKLSMHYITGTEDTLNPINGGIPRVAISKPDNKRLNDKEKPPVINSINKWKNALNCSKKATLDKLENGVQTRIYSSKSEDKVVYITIEDLGHIWAGSPSKQPKMIVGTPTDKLKATDVIWKFFKSIPIK